MKIQNLILAAVLTLISWSAQATDVAGKWVGEFESQIGHQKYTFNFQTAGDKLTATAEAESEQGKRQVTFTEVKQAGDTLSFVEMRQVQDNEIRIEYSGKIGTNQIQFTRKVGDFGTQEFAAKREAVAPAAVSAATSTDISGQWRAEFDTQIGMQKYLYTLHADGGKVTGKANAEVNGEKRETELQEGKIAGDTVTFVENLKFQDNDIRIEYTGKIHGDEISFTRKVADFATEEFVAKRDRSTPASAATSTNSTH